MKFIGGRIIAMICCREDVGCARLLKNNRACLFFHEMHGSIGLQQKGWLKMEVLQKIQLPAGELKLPCGIRLLNAAVPLYTGAGTEYFMMGTIADDHELEIVEEREGKGQRLWGRLRNNAGWIPMDLAEKRITQKC